MPSSSSLFLEATQRKTVRTVIAVLRADPIEVEAQEVGVATPRRNRRRPAVPVAADVPQHTGAVHAEARGGPLGTRRLGFSPIIGKTKSADLEKRKVQNFLHVSPTLTSNT